MTDLERVNYLIAKGEAHNAGSWARKIARAAFSDYLHLRVWTRPKLDILELASAQHSCHVPHDLHHFHRSC